MLSAVIGTIPKLIRGGVRLDMCPSPSVVLHSKASCDLRIIPRPNNPKALADAVRADRAWQLYDVLLSDSRVEFLEPSGLEATWRTLTHGRDFSPKLWNDCYLAAFAMLTGCEIVTFDRGFTQFKQVKSTILT